MRVFFYGHAAGLGAGHFVRSLRLAEAARLGGAEVMVTSPGPQLQRLNRQDVPLLPLPALQGLQADLELVEQRGRAIVEFLRQWQPDQVVVDTLPFGHGGELLPTLAAAAEEGWPCRFWWGLPYAEAKVSPLKNPRLRKALTHYYGLLVYAEANEFDPVPSYAAFPLPERVFHVGMVTEPMLKGDAHEPMLACLVGSGGLAGASQLIAAVARQRPNGVAVRYVAGPLAGVRCATPDGDTTQTPLRGVETVPEADLNQALLGVSAVVSRVGYNTAFSLMRGDLPVLFIPTAWPEQFQRAQQLSKLEGVMVLSEERVETSLAESLARLLELPRRPRQLPFRVDGASNAADLLLGQTAEGALITETLSRPTKS